MVKIGIIGGGFAGLGAAYYLKKNIKNPDLEITIYENNEKLGGLASGFKSPEWDWPIDRVIHHWFTTDKWALAIAKEIGMEDKLIIGNTRSACFYQGKVAELDSATSLLKFPFLNIFDRIRMGAVMALMRFDKNYLKYEKETSFSFIKRTMGKRPFEVVWKPLFLGKFGENAKDITAAWFWARINPRTKDLAYIEGGFQTFVDEIGKNLRNNGCKIILNAGIKKVSKNKKGFLVNYGDKKNFFDIVILAVPMQVSFKLFDFPKDYLDKYQSLKSIGAQYFVLELKKPFLPDRTYWLNVNHSDFPFMMVAEHTNFVDKKHYNNKHMIWVGKYLDYDGPLWKMNEKDLLKKIIPYLKKINSDFKEIWIERSFFTRFQNAQPIIPINYSKKIPSIKTPVENLYIANMNHVYPWDRGTNNALALGEKIAKTIAPKFS